MGASFLATRYFIQSPVFRKRIIILLLIISLVVGGWLRWKYFLNQSVFLEDEGRDLLVARHIAIYGETIPLGHDTSDIHWLYYPPYYFYFLAGITRLIDNPYKIFIIFSLLNLVTIYLIYQIGKNIFSESVGVITALLYAVNRVSIQAINVFAPYIALSLFIVSFFFFTLFYQRRQILFLILHVVLITLAAFFSYEFLYLLPTFYLWSCYIWWKYKRENIFKFIIGLGIFCAVLVILGFLPVVRYFGDRLTTNLLFTQTFELDLNSILDTLWKSSLNFSELIYPGKYAFLFFLITQVLIIITLFKNYKKVYPAFYLYIIFIVGLVLTSVKKGTVVWHHTIALIPLYFLMLAISIYHLNRRKLLPIYLLFIFLQLNVFNNGATVSDSVRVDSNTLYQSDKISEHITSILTSNQKIAKSFDIFTYSDLPSPTYIRPPNLYYFLERKMNTQYTTIVPETFNNFQLLITESPSYIFLICRTSYNSDYPNRCIDEFMQIYSFKAISTQQFWQSPQTSGWLLQGET